LSCFNIHKRAEYILESLHIVFIMQNGDYMNQNEEMAKCIKVGLIALSAFLLVIIGIYSLSDAVSVYVASQEKKLPIYCVEKEKPQVSLSFDAAWGNEDTQAILDVLSKYNINVTFFMTGGWVDQYPDDVKNIAKAGHDLGNHSQNHKQMSQLSATECEKEITLVNEKVRELTKKTPQLFRPPYGDYNDTLVETVAKCNCYCIQWDVDSLDWKNYGVDAIVSTVLNHKALGNGSIILMHNGAKYTKDALPAVIEGLQKKGFEIVPISKLIYKDNYEINHEGRQISLDKETKKD